MALSLERDSIVFYMFLRGPVPSVDRKKEIDRVGLEEIGHVRRLKEMRARRGRLRPAEEQLTRTRPQADRPSFLLAEPCPFLSEGVNPLCENRYLPLEHIALGLKLCLSVLDVGR